MAPLLASYDVKGPASASRTADSVIPFWERSRLDREAPFGVMRGKSLRAGDEG